MTNKEIYILFAQVIWKMRYWLVPCISVILACALYEAIEDKWESRNK